MANHPGPNQNQLEGEFKYSPKLHSSDPFRIRASRNPEQHERTGFKVSEIQAIHHKVKRLSFLGYKNKDIAIATGLSPQTVSNILKSPIIKYQLELMHGAADADALDLKEQIDALAPHALANLQEVILYGTLNFVPVDVKEIIRESNNVLDRNLGKPTQNLKGEMHHTYLTTEEIEEMKQRAIAEANRQKQIPEATIIKVEEVNEQNSKRSD